MTRRFRRVQTALLGASLVALAAPALASSTLFDDGAVSGPIDIDDSSSLIGEVSKQINVNGRLVTVSATVSNIWFLLSPNGGASQPISTSVRVNLDSADGQDLPAVRAVRIKLERVKPPMRIYKSQLFIDDTFVFDPKHAGYGGTITAFRPGVRLRATVTLTTADETRIVRLGEVRVRPLQPIIFGGGLTE